ncbi:MAG: triose-phosphate isomerase [Oceanipulchritudo sp.]
MAKTIRKYLIAGNWKMNKTGSEGADLVREIDLSVGKQTDVGVAVCPPFTALESCAKALEDSNIQLGAQNMHPKLEGAYTGEISPVMLRSLFCTFVIIGHSERREYFKESDAFINEKVLAALESSLKPILCVGETLEQREANETISVVKTQLIEGLKGVDADSAENLVIAYEPVWAIGTGKTATPEMAQEVHKMIREELKALLGATAAAKVRILYGGSMKPENASELLDQPDIDGGLIGGASLKAKSFVDLVEIARTK